VDLERTWNRARMYDAAKQWLQPARGSQSRMWYAWEPMRLKGKGDLFPRPVRNIFSMSMQDEVARLVGVGSRPYIKLTNIEAEEAAELAKQVLTDRNELTGWQLDQRQGAYHAAMFGQWVEGSKWSINLMKSIKGPLTSITKCADCGSVLSAPNANGKTALETVRNVGRVGTSFPGGIHAEPHPDDPSRTNYALDHCPECGPTGKLEPYEPPAEEYTAKPDYFGRPMTKNYPLGEDQTFLISPYSFFPENQGVGYSKDEDMMEFGLRTPRSIPWGQVHYENGKELKVTDNMDMFQHHPVVTGAFLSYRPEGVWRNHFLEDVWCQVPTPDFPRGRCIIMGGRTVLFDGEYFLPDTELPYIKVCVAPWELRENEIWGKSLAEDVFSPQDNLNSTMSQAMDIRQKYTSPKVFLHEGMNLQFSGGANSAYSGDIWTVDTRGIPPELAARFPLMFGNQGVPGSVWQEMDRDLQHVQNATGARDAEIGAASGVEAQNYSALLLQATKSAERRKPRHDGFRGLMRRIWTHRLQVIAAKYIEERELHVKEDDKWTLRTFHGFQLKDQTDVALEDDPIVDTSVALRASIEQALTWQTIRTSAMGGSYGADRKINRAIGIPDELTEDRNVQEDAARREWNQWIDDGIEPAVDDQADDHQIHSRRHFLDMEGKRADEIKEQLTVPWNVIILKTSEWERLLTELQMSLLAYRAAPPPDQLFAMYGNGAAQQMQKIQMLRQRVQNFPGPLELQIYECFKRLLASIRMPVDGSLAILLRFRAHALAAYRLANGIPDITKQSPADAAMPIRMGGAGMTPPPPGPGGEGAPPPGEQPPGEAPAEQPAA
jgi:hypothetical protein